MVRRNRGLFPLENTLYDKGAVGLTGCKGDCRPVG